MKAAPITRRALGVCAALVTAVASADARADLQMASAAPDGCPTSAYFAEQAQRRGLRGSATVAISREDGEFVGKIWFLGGPGPEAREVRGPTCDAVADTLVLIAEVHERPASGPMPASAILSVPPPALPPSASAASPAASAPPAQNEGTVAPEGPRAIGPSPAIAPPRRAAEPRVFSFGVGMLLDSAVVPSLAWGGMLVGRVAPPHSLVRTRGWITASVGYLAGSVDVGDVHVSHRRWFGRLTGVPYALAIGPGLRLGVALGVGAARLGVKADVPLARDDARPLIDVGLGPRLLSTLGPASLELGADLVLPVSRRRFVLPEREEPVFRLPAAAFAAFLAVGPR